MTRDIERERRLLTTGGTDLCSKCKQYRTRRDDGVCFRCFYGYKVEFHKYVEKFRVEHPIPFPAEHKETILPCQYEDPEMFAQDEATQEARECCWRCPVQDWCLSFGMYNKQWGIWGGLTKRERLIVLDGLSKDRVVLVA